MTRSCQCVGLSRSAHYRVSEDLTVRYAPLIGALAALVAGRPNRGFWECRKLLRAMHGLPQVLRKDNGPEFLGEAFTQWAKQAGTAIQCIQSGKPNQNAYVERFNRTVRDELLDQHLFARLDDVREAAYWWMIKYIEERPHDALDDLTPLEACLQSARISTNKLSP